MPRRFMSRIKETMESYDGEDPRGFATDLKHYIDRTYKRSPHMYSVTKKLIKRYHPLDLDLHQWALDILHESTEERRATERKMQEALEIRNDVVTVFNYEYVADVAKECLKSDSMAQLFVGLQLACGCRQRDIFDPAMCEFLFSGNDHDIIQVGGSKRRGKKQTTRKPLLFYSAAQFLSRLKVFRAVINMDPRSAEKKTNLWNKELGQMSSHFFPLDAPIRSGTHVNRAIYAAVLRFKGKAKGSAVRRTQQYLNHDAMKTSLHYMHVDISADEGFCQSLHLSSSVPRFSLYLSIPQYTSLESIPSGG